ncbi:hypothetical protein GALL_302070 [mine drainage metagenome]|uniref:Protein kinase domain-containing protein n=1 Tax=mine drainage metagenome TaxID=410659 RepID=A0A1J5QWJ7_9ZZZZ
MANEELKGNGPAVTLRERYQIYPGSPLPGYSGPTSQAFYAEDRRDPKRAYFALIVRPGFPPRTNLLRALKGVECPGLMTMAEWGVVDWPPANRKVMAVVYERPLGERVMESLSATFRRIDEGEAVRKVVTPLTEALKKLRALGITHRGIRPTNMFWATPERDRIVLGDGATTPPGYDQPAALEALESAQCHPAGRGNGSFADDAYALGASLSILLQGRALFVRQDDAAILRAKMLNGSYSALVGDARMPVQMIEVLRGLMGDDAQQRWHVEALELWVAGRRLTPLVNRNEKRAARAFSFNGGDYNTARELAVAMAGNYEQAAQIILDGRLELWLRRSLDMAEKAGVVNDTMHVAVAGTMDRKYAFDYMVAKVCMLLDPLAPIRYKGLGVMPDGLGPLLAVTMVEGGDINLIAECILRSLSKAWVETRESYNPENSIMESAFNQQKVHLERQSIGSGPERLLYEMNPSMPCISQYTVDDYVVDIRDLLPALNAAAAKNAGKGWPIDRHVAAFVAARVSFDIERPFFDLADGNPLRSILAMLNILALLQWRLGQGGLAPLAGWVAGMLAPAITSFHNREIRKELEREVPRLAREGNLVEMARLLDSPEARQQDIKGFEEARQVWAERQRLIKDIEAGHVGTDEEGVKTARQIAALISVTIAFITTVLLLIARIFNG